MHIQLNSIRPERIINKLFTNDILALYKYIHTHSTLNHEIVGLVLNLFISNGQLNSPNQLVYFEPMVIEYDNIH